MSNQSSASFSFPGRDDGEYADLLTATRSGVYTGSVKDHRMSGDGVLVTSLGTFTGTFVADELEGNGVYKAREDAGSSAVPDAPEPVATGHFSFLTPLLPAVREYRGGFHHSVFEGVSGLLCFKNGDTYEGPFAAGFPEGTEGGAYTFADGRTYRGGMKGGLLHGHGRLTQVNGDYYDGEFIGGAMTGYGTANYGGGARVFTGLWDDGAKVKGKLSFPGSERMYNGQWHDERPHGQGAMVFANGDKYEGDFVSGMLQGVGLLTYANQPGGRYYYGQFFEDQPFGRGRLISLPEGTDAAKENTVEGYFLRGQLVPASDAAAIDQVIATTKGLPQPEGKVPFPEVKAAAHVEEGVGVSPLSGGPSTHAAAATSTVESPASQAPNKAPNGSSPGGTHLSGAENVTGSPQHTRGSSSGTGDVDLDLELSETDAEDNEEAVLNDSIAGSFTPVISNHENSADDSCKGWLEKCSIGRSTLGLISNWKRRFFILAAFQGNVCLGYYDDELCRKPIGFLRLSSEDTRIVTRPSSRTHKKASKPGRELCVIYHEHRKTYKLLLRAADAAEHDRWVAAFLRHFTIVNRPTDHPLPVE